MPGTSPGHALDEVKTTPEEIVVYTSSAKMHAKRISHSPKPSIIIRNRTLATIAPNVYKCKYE
jgi:hypothetical protein